jgi:hypothetical protein
LRTRFGSARRRSLAKAGPPLRSIATPRPAARPPCVQAIRDVGGAREAAFDVVVAEALDRLSRDREDVAALFKRLHSLGYGW